MEEAAGESTISESTVSESTVSESWVPVNEWHEFLCTPRKSIRLEHKPCTVVVAVSVTYYRSVSVNETKYNHHTSDDRVYEVFWKSGEKQCYHSLPSTRCILCYYTWSVNS